MPGQESDVEGWLRGTGFPLEFRAAHILMRAGFRTLRGHYVADEESDTSLEIDILSAADDEALDGTPVSVRYCVECKHIDTKTPWAFFKGGYDILPHMRLESAVGTPLAELALFDLAGDLEYRELIGQNRLFGARSASAYGGKSKAREEAKSGKPDAVYAGLCDVVSRVAHLSSGGGGRVTATVNIPLIVVTDEMYLVDYDGTSDKLVVSSIPSVRVDWNGTTKKSVFGIDIITIEELERTAGSLFLSAKQFAADITKSVNRLHLARDTAIDRSLRTYLEERQKSTTFQWPSLATEWLSRSEGGT